MSKRMLIDASHPEETRVVILSGNRVEEFDFESASRKPLKGNIYLAKVTRVEPSLQAAFVEYGGNRHGFLAFSEIHPDYYQIPVADRQALLAAQRAEERARAHEEEAAEAPNGDAESAHVPPPSAGEDDPLPTHAALPEDGNALASGFESIPTATDEAVQAQLDSPTAPQALQEPAETSPETAHHVLTRDEVVAAASPEQDAMGRPEGDAPDESAAPEGDNSEPQADAESPSEGEGGVEELVAENVEAETVSAGEDDDALDEVEVRRPSYNRMMRNYKIQEVIKKRQILLIQVVKEERGNKGAALTTYLSLAGRYCVLMPNSGRGGGISRKITNSADRRRLKEAAESMDVPDGMSLIVRTAGASRTKQEIQRDYEYLLRLWDSIRDLTLRSTAPALVYEEGNLIKRAIRDQFSRDIEEIVVEGSEGYEEALGFTKMLMPQQAEAVKLHDGRPPLFQKFRVESQLDSMFNPRVQLKSGGYLIINQTEALVAIDVNSGRSTREHSIEDTALKTNLEAAEEVARQLRLRDLAGLIVIDFIDMEENRNDRSVERRLKDCLRHDRARIQIGRISPFGLLEMSRQRLRPGMVEGSTVACPHCNGTGLIRSVESLALRALRSVEEEAQQSKTDGITVRLPTEVAVYIFNHKRADILGMEERLNISIFVEAKNDMFGADCEVEIGTGGASRPRRVSSSSAVSAETALSQMPEPDEDEAEVEIDSSADSDDEAAGPSSGGSGSQRSGHYQGSSRGSRSRSRGGSSRSSQGGSRPPSIQPSAPAADPMPVLSAEDGDMDLVSGESGDETATPSNGAPQSSGSSSGSSRSGRRRRGRRGGRRSGTSGASGGSDMKQVEGGDADAETEADARPASEARAPVQAPEFVPANTQSAPPSARPERKSAAAAIARFFGFGKPEDEAPLSPAAEVPTAAVTPAAPEPAPAYEPAPMPQSEVPATTFIAAHDPGAATVVPEPSIQTEVAIAEPNEAPAPAPVAIEVPEVVPPAPEPEPEPQPEPVAAEPVAPKPIVIPKIEKAEIIVTGEVAGPPKGGWWKKP